MLMGYREYARHRGVTLGAVQKAIREGRISATEEKKIDSVAADRDWGINTDSSRVAVNALAQRAQPMQLEIPAVAPGGARESDDDAEAKAGSDCVAGTDRVANEYREHRSTRERYQALQQQLAYERDVGQLINVDEAKRIVYTSFRALRDAVMNVPARTKDLLAVESDPLACELLLERELAAALAGIDVKKLLQDQDPDGDE
ncbi:MAG: hypothetical protein K2X55_01040 [Burkholderiaceae bacterium]|nr:hypothetical protein [Burkholderiaceae bacterium]